VEILLALLAEIVTVCGTGDVPVAVHGWVPSEEAVAPGVMVMLHVPAAASVLPQVDEADVPLGQVG
jgi:hypothetical protein